MAGCSSRITSPGQKTCRRSPCPSIALWLWARHFTSVMLKCIWKWSFYSLTLCYIWLFESSSAVTHSVDICHHLKKKKNLLRSCYAHFCCMNRKIILCLFFRWVSLDLLLTIYDSKEWSLHGVKGQSGLVLTANQVRERGHFRGKNTGTMMCVWSWDDLLV